MRALVAHVIDGVSDAGAACARGDSNDYAAEAMGTTADPLMATAWPNGPAVSVSDRRSKSRATGANPGSLTPFSRRQEGPAAARKK